jgi:hypothetical protein
MHLPMSSRVWRTAILAGLLFPVLMFPVPTSADSHQPTVEELKARIAKAAISERSALCLQLSEMQLGAANRFYTAGDSNQANIALNDVVAYAELARDYSIQSHKHEKQSEIAIRKMVRKLNDLKHAVTREDQPRIDDTITKLEQVRDDLLSAMFPKGNNK